MLVAAVHGASWFDVLAHQNDYVCDIQNGQVLTLDMDRMLKNLLDKEKAIVGQIASEPKSDKGRF